MWQTEQEAMMMTATTARRTGGRTKKRRAGGPVWMRLLKGLGAALLASLAGVAVFALLMQWIRPSDGVVRIFNQVLKLVSIGFGVFVGVGRGQDGGLLRGALLGLVYMALGVGVYALLTGCSPSASAWLADLGMGVAGGGIVGMLLTGMSPR